MGRYGEMWGDVGRYGEVWGDVGRCGEIWRRYGEIWGDIERRAPLARQDLDGGRVGERVHAWKEVVH